MAIEKQVPSSNLVSSSHWILSQSKLASFIAA
jgi:hypothetical protein